MLAFSRSCSSGLRRVLDGALARPTSRISPSTGAAPIIPDDEYADIVADDRLRSSESNCDSPWSAREFKPSPGLSGNEALEVSRSQPLPVSKEDRLRALWSFSNSHGVSWDDLDEAFLRYHQDYVNKDKEWMVNYDAMWNEEYAKSEDALRRTLTGDASAISLIMSRRRGKIRRMTYTRLARRRFKDVLQPFQLPKFLDYMRDFTAPRVMLREECEKSLS